MIRMTLTAFALALLTQFLPAQEPATPPAGAATEGIGTGPAGQEVKPAIHSIMERRFLDGRITAKQYQQFLSQYRPPAVLPEITNTAPQVKDLESPLGRTPPAPTQVVPSFPYTNAVPSVPANLTGAAPGGGSPPDLTGSPAPGAGEEGKPSLAEVEARMNELLRLQKDREEAGAKEAAPGAQEKLPRRERLNRLLRLYIEDRISAAEYERERNKVIAEPDEPKP